MNATLSANLFACLIFVLVTLSTLSAYSSCRIDLSLGIDTHSRQRHSVIVPFCYSLVIAGGDSFYSLNSLHHSRHLHITPGTLKYKDFAIEKVQLREDRPCCLPVPCAYDNSI